jgi:hypothetical protein
MSDAYEAYCAWCGNVKIQINHDTDKWDQPCPSCQKLLDQMPAAKIAFDLLRNEWTTCCAGITVSSSSRPRPLDLDCASPQILALISKEIQNFPIRDRVDTTHIHFHSKYGDSAYPQEVEDGEAQTCVECGINLYDSHAQAYYIIDTDHCVESFAYGPEIPYGLGEEGFLKVASLILNEAAEAAQNDGWLSCEKCGYNHQCESPCDCPDDDEDEDEDEEENTNPDDDETSPQETP